MTNQETTYKVQDSLLENAVEIIEEQTNKIVATLTLGIHKSWILTVLRPEQTTSDVYLIANEVDGFSFTEAFEQSCNKLAYINANS